MGREELVGDVWESRARTSAYVPPCIRLVTAKTITSFADVLLSEENTQERRTYVKLIRFEARVVVNIVI